MPSYLTQKEAAELLRVSERQISRYRASGKLAFLKLGGSIRFHRSHVEAMLQPAETVTAAPHRSWTATRWTDDASELPASITRPVRKSDFA